jgi:hypothetical protein
VSRVLNASAPVSPATHDAVEDAVARLGYDDHDRQPLADAFLWIKVPGESDGHCNRDGNPAGIDTEWGIVDPPAGRWFPQQALQLAQLANPPLP